MRLLLLILFTLTSMHSYSQAITKVLIIDTVAGSLSRLPVKVRWLVMPRMQNNAAGDSIFKDRADRQADTAAVVNFTSYPNACIVVSANASSASIALPLDDSGGELRLINPFILPKDTIRISKLTIFHNCLPDSVSSGMYWYRDLNNDTSGLQLLKKKEFPDRAINKSCNEVTPSNLNTLVNGRMYTTPIKIHLSTVLMQHSCGGHKKMGRWRTHRYEHRKYNGKPYTYIYSKTRKSSYILTAEMTYWMVPSTPSIDLKPINFCQGKTTKALTTI